MNTVCPRNWWPRTNREENLLFHRRSSENTGFLAFAVNNADPKTLPNELCIKTAPLAEWRRLEAFLGSNALGIRFVCRDWECVSFLGNPEKVDPFTTVNLCEPWECIPLPKLHPVNTNCAKPTTTIDARQWRVIFASCRTFIGTSRLRPESLWTNYQQAVDAFESLSLQLPTPSRFAPPSGATADTRFGAPKY